MTKRVVAVEHVRRMQGGSQAHLLRCSDGEHYVVKFQNNPQGTRILVNEMLGGVLATRLGLPTPETAIVDVNDLLRQNSGDLIVQVGRGQVACTGGSCFGSRLPSETGPNGTRVLQSVHRFLPEFPPREVTNIADFAGMLVFDKWTGNMDSRQVIFVYDAAARAYRAMMIDNGFCFNGGDWDFPNAPRCGLSARPSAYEAVRGMDSFEHWLQILDNVTGVHLLDGIADDIPREWYGSEMNTLRHLLQETERRRRHVRASLWTTRSGSPQRFPNWCLKHRLILCPRGQYERLEAKAKTA
jgi:HipA-like protein